MGNVTWILLFVETASQPVDRSHAVQPKQILDPFLHAWMKLRYITRTGMGHLEGLLAPHQVSTQSSEHLTAAAEVTGVRSRVDFR
jgi:hypothetical protein